METKKSDRRTGVPRTDVVKLKISSGQTARWARILAKRKDIKTLLPQILEAFISENFEDFVEETGLDRCFASVAYATFVSDLYEEKRLYTTLLVKLLELRIDEVL